MMRRPIGLRLILGTLAATLLFTVNIRAQAPLVLTNADTEPILKNLHQQEIRSLRGLRDLKGTPVGITVAAEIVVPDQLNKVVTDTGLKVDDIRKIVIDEITRLGIHVVPEKQWTLGAPFLKVKVEFYSETSKGPYIGLVKLALAQMVALNSQMPAKKVNPDPKDYQYSVILDARNLAYGETWHSQWPFYAQDQSGIVGAVKPLVDKLAQGFDVDYAASK